MNHKLGLRGSEGGICDTLKFQKKFVQNSKEYYYYLLY